MNLTARDEQTFYGMNLPSIKVSKLTAKLFHGKKNGQFYTRLDLQDDKGTKWQIRPTSFSRKKIPASFTLYHRNTYGRRGFHAQNVTSRGTRSSAVRELLTYITHHEQYENEPVYLSDELRQPDHSDSSEHCWWYPEQQGTNHLLREKQPGS